MENDRWVCLIVKIGKEAEVALEMADQGVETYVPTQIVWRSVPKHRRNKVGSAREKICLRLIPGVVFAKLAESFLPYVSNIRHVSYVLSNAGSTFIPDEQVEALRASLSAPEDQDKPFFCPSTMIGSILKVASGIMEGREGLVEGYKDKHYEIKLDGISVLVPISNFDNG